LYRLSTNWRKTALKTWGYQLSNELTGNPSNIPDPDFYPSLIPDPEFYPSRIPDPTKATKEEGEK
jgi:hypothetical protein